MEDSLMSGVKQRILQVLADAVAAALPTFDERTGRFMPDNGCRITLPHGATFRWPVVGFNPYAADGAAPFGAERGVLSARIDGQPARWKIQILDCRKEEVRGQPQSKAERKGR